MTKHLYVYCDGGLAVGNPSYIGGGYGFRIVEHAEPKRGGSGAGGAYGPKDNDADRILQEVIGPLLPSDLAVGAVSNNHAELYALCRAIEAAAALSPAPSAVTFCPDSLYAKGAIDETRKVREDPPPVLTALYLEARARLKSAPFAVYWELIAGHPEEGLVIDGIKYKGSEAAPRLYRVSRHNGAVDAGIGELCARLPRPTWEEIAERQGAGLFNVGDVDAVTVKGKRTRQNR